MAKKAYIGQMLSMCGGKDALFRHVVNQVFLPLEENLYSVFSIASFTFHVK